MSSKPPGEKTEEPTPKRLKEAHEQGQVVKSTDVVTTLGTLLVLSTILMILPGFSQRIAKYLATLFLIMSGTLTTSVASALSEGTMLLLSAVFPVAGAAIVGAILGNVLQFGFIFASKAMKPDLKKLNPVEGLKRMFSLKSLVELTKSSLKVIILGSLLYWVIRSSLGPLMTLPFAQFISVIDVVKPMFIHFIVSFLLAYVAIAILDFLIQRKLIMKELMMTKEEVKQERKEMEGNPEIKGQRRRLQREMVYEDTSSATKKSTVLVTNPIHYAAAIYYERGKTRLPILRAKGSGFVALRMISVAQEYHVPIVENIPLARALYDELEVNDVVPNELLEPITEILRWVYSLPKRY